MAPLFFDPCSGIFPGAILARANDEIVVKYLFSKGANPWILTKAASLPVPPTQVGWNRRVFTLVGMGAVEHSIMRLSSVSGGRSSGRRCIFKIIGPLLKRSVDWSGISSSITMNGCTKHWATRHRPRSMG
jgi:hypothetical protein